MDHFSITDQEHTDLLAAPDLFIKYPNLFDLLSLPPFFEFSQQSRSSATPVLIGVSCRVVIDQARPV